ncbi:MAG: ABC transporter ATP-binding protein, partial [Desulfovibrionaceae bacterium]
AVSASNGGVAYLVKPAIDKIFVSKDTTALAMVPLAFIGVMLAKGVARFLQCYLMNTTSLRVTQTLRNDTFSKILRLPMDYFDKSRVGVIMSRALGDVGGVSSIGPTAIMLGREILTVFVLLGYVFYLDAFLAVCGVVVLPLAMYPFLHFGKKLRRIGRETQVQAAALNNHVQENISGIRVVKAFAKEQPSFDRFAAESDRVVRIGLRGVLASELSSRFMELVGALGAGLVIWYGGKEVIAGHSTPGTFFSFITSMIMLYDPVKSINDNWLNLQKSFASTERVFDLLDSPSITVEQGGDTALDEPFRSLDVEGVRFTYPTGARPALDGVDLTVRAGERVALVGPSGGGKTTLANLLPRFYDPQEGVIRLNGRPLKDYTLQSLRLSMGVVSQDAFLFNMTIAENIGYVEGEHTREAIEAAAKAAYAHDFILGLSEGYETVVGERGVKLSGGQKQRITIARAILKNPPLLILDEATSALDTESERIVQMALDNLMADRTTVVIAHRLSTVLSADMILVVDQGHIVGRGRHEELLTTCPLYKRLYEMQFQSDSWNGAQGAIEA